MVKRGSEHHRISVKIRVFEDTEKSIAYAKMIESAGACALTVHGRTIEQKRELTGLASWGHIRAIKQTLNIPIIANGNIRNRINYFYFCHL